LGLLVSTVSWAGLVGLLVRARGAREQVAAALATTDDSGLEPPDAVPSPRTPRLQLALAFPVGDQGLGVLRDLEYAPGAGRRHRLDVYRPAGGVHDAPVLVQIHGGAWTIGNKRQQARPLLHHLAALGWVCVTPNYRLSPKATFPEHLVDVKLALQWVREHISELGGDPNFVVVTGGSAGAHLAALAALTAGDPQYQPFEAVDEPVDMPVDMSVQACVPFYGIYDLTAAYGRGTDGMRGFLERTVFKKRLAAEPEAFAAASPIRRVRRDAPAFMVVHGTHDSFAPVHEARAFVEALRAVSREPVVYLELPGAQHAFEVFHSIRTELVIAGVARFLTGRHAAYLRERDRGDGRDGRDDQGSATATGSGT
jgi:acetyl esterase/lipase